MSGQGRPIEPCSWFCCSCAQLAAVLLHHVPLLRRVLLFLLSSGGLVPVLRACRSSRSHAIFTITVEQRRRQMVRPASAPPAVESTPRRRGLQVCCAGLGGCWLLLGAHRKPQQVSTALEGQVSRHGR